jgi:hypothetical protein
MWRLTITQIEQRAYRSIEGTYESEDKVIFEADRFLDLVSLVSNFSCFEINNTKFIIEKAVE